MGGASEMIFAGPGKSLCFFGGGVTPASLKGVKMHGVGLPLGTIPIVSGVGYWQGNLCIFHGLSHGSGF